MLQTQTSPAASTDAESSIESPFNLDEDELPNPILASYETLCPGGSSEKKMKGQAESQEKNEGV